MKYITINVLILLNFCGCGNFDRFKASMTGEATKTCMDGVLYYQFTSGAVPAYHKNGNLKGCE